MTIVDTTETIREWLEKNVCPLVKLKLPDDNHTDESYPYKLITPGAFSLYVPTSDRLPPKVAAPIPSVCVELVIGDDDLIKSSREIKVRLNFSAWDPGYHSRDLLYPQAASVEQYNAEAIKAFQKNDLGWRDVWNFTDTVLREIESAEYIGGLRLIKEKGITFGPFSEEKATPNFYPYWFSWAEFSVESSITRKPSEEYEALL